MYSGSIFFWVFTRVKHVGGKVTNTEGILNVETTKPINHVARLILAPPHIASLASVP